MESAATPLAVPANTTPEARLGGEEGYMSEPTEFEELICIVSAMDRDTISEKLLSFRGSFPVDFTEDFLQDQPLDRLRHIFLALCLQNRRAALAEIPSAA